MKNRGPLADRKAAKLEKKKKYIIDFDFILELHMTRFT